MVVVDKSASSPTLSLSRPSQLVASLLPPFIRNLTLFSFPVDSCAVPLEKIEYNEFPTIHFNAHESVEMPFRAFPSLSLYSLPSHPDASASVAAVAQPILPRLLYLCARTKFVFFVVLNATQDTSKDLMENRCCLWG